MVLTRTSQKAKIFQVNYSNITCVIDDLDFYDVLRIEMTETDLILHCVDANHEAETLTLLNKLVSKKNNLEKKTFIHISDAASLLDLNIIDDHLDESTTKIYRDIHECRNHIQLFFRSSTCCY